MRGTLEYFVNSYSYLGVFVESEIIVEYWRHNDKGPGTGPFSAQRFGGPGVLTRETEGALILAIEAWWAPENWF